MQGDQPLKPANILNIVATNQGHRPLTAGIPKAAPLSPARVQELMAEGTLVVDARSSAAFGSGHIPGAINIQAAGSEFEQRVGWIIPDGTPIVLVTETDAEAQACIYEMAFIAMDSAVTGFLEDGMDAWMGAGLPMRSVRQITVTALREQLELKRLRVLDVRRQEEWDEGHIHDAVFMPYTSMVQQLDTPPQLDKLPLGFDEPIAVTCAGGFRSSTAISLMMLRGYFNVTNLTGGMTAWNDAGLPTE
jgi:hydroxyacylglutathione hydrolase